MGSRDFEGEPRPQLSLIVAETETDESDSGSYMGADAHWPRSESSNPGFHTQLSRLQPVAGGRKMWYWITTCVVCLFAGCLMTKLFAPQMDFSADDMELAPSLVVDIPADAWMRWADEQNTTHDASPNTSVELPLPACVCSSVAGKTRGDRMATLQKNRFLCMNPWGEPRGQQHCTPPSAQGLCKVTTRKCNSTFGILQTTASRGPTIVDGPCLCGFDVDRTLTAAQRRHCANTSVVDGTFDKAFGGGKLTLSSLATRGIARTACGSCYLAVVSRGTMEGTTNKNRRAILSAIMTPPFAQLAAEHADALNWSHGSRTWESSINKVGYGLGRIHSPLVILQEDKQKQWAVEGVLQWYASKGIAIPRERVFFFDDRVGNALHFNGTTMNARQVSCRSQTCTESSGPVGLCGATPEEIILTPGVKACPGKPLYCPPKPPPVPKWRFLMR